MSAPPPQAWLNALLALLQQAQLTLLQAWHALGWTGDLHGQPAWPFAQRIAGETLWIDLGLARQLALTLVAIAIALACLGIAAFWRRRRMAWLGVGALALVLAPWPAPALLLTPAAPTSFHTSPTGFAVRTIAEGASIYRQHCAACHGDDGRGEGPRSASLSRWPPTFASPLLARRAEGELFWHIVAGMRDAQGHATMPAFGSQIGDDQAWAVIDYLKTLAAGTGAATQGNWPIPLRLPDVAVRCGRELPQRLADWRGRQRVRVVAFDGAPAALPLEDPRYRTLLVTRDGAPLANVPPFRAGCVAASTEAWPAFARLSGIDAAQLPGTAWLADRDGWLRARALPGQAAWRDADLLCTTGQPAGQGTAEGAAEGTAKGMAEGTAKARGVQGVSNATNPADGLTALLLRMDAEPVRFVQGHFIH